MKEVQWHEEGRGRKHRHIATLGNKRLFVDRAPALFGRWQIVRPLPGTTPGHCGRPASNREALAYANDLREARVKAEMVIRGHHDERSASNEKWVRKSNPRYAHEVFQWERAPKGKSR